MKVIEVTEKEVKAAFDAAKSDEVKNVLAALFASQRIVLSHPWMITRVSKHTKMLVRHLVKNL